jgi:glycosyltransferase involved in cell wall biosynthesis
LPSKREGMPQSLIEAMACGNIVIASDIEACRELVKEGKIGYLFRQGDAEDLAEKIKEVIRSYRKMGKVQKNAVKFASGFKWKTIADRLEKVYKGVKN